ncbi:biotin transporter BioY [Corynebacterium sp. TAE3-ERU12]|uniref:biotin transporter BioY n=1 Tax=Corynebacterium sp. TAE3-ERU12 TaxID=2849491 RepID=UPI001C45C967|nr:biotin transporter BioY [Corynebacterium sp. TAE3-ERU12]
MQKNAIRDLVLIAAFAALIIVLGLVAIPVGVLGVPIVLQNMGVILVGMLLGWKRGTLAVILFLAVGLLNVPNLAGMKTTLAALSGPTIGYLAGYILAAFLVGMLTAKRPSSSGGQFALFTGAGIVGLIAMYVLGSIGLIFRTDLPFTEALLSNGVYIPLDLVKVVFAALIAIAVLKAVPQLRPRTSRTA